MKLPTIKTDSSKAIHLVKSDKVVFRTSFYVKDYINLINLNTPLPLLIFIENKLGNLKPADRITEEILSTIYLYIDKNDSCKVEDFTLRFVRIHYKYDREIINLVINTHRRCLRDEHR